MKNTLPPDGWPHNIPAEATMDIELSRAKMNLFMANARAGWLGSLLCNHKFIWDLSCGTAWCDGDTIGICPTFFYSLSDGGKKALLAHELWHTGYDHMSRRHDRDPEIWNWAADYVINLVLKDDGYDMESLGPCLLNEAYRNMSTERIYDILVKDAKEIPVPEGFTGDIKDPDPKKSSNITSKIIAAKQSAEMNQDEGSLPGEVTIFLDEFLSPVLPWEQLLSRFFTELSNDDYSYRRPSRRHEEEYLPSMISDNGLEHLIYFFDVSGSVSEGDIKRFNSEVKYIHEEMVPKNLTVVTFDTKIQNVLHFSEGDPFERIEITGRGGTDLDPVHKYIEKHRPTAAVIFSDLHCYPMAATSIPILWVILGNHKVRPPVGQVIHLDSEG